MLGDAAEDPARVPELGGEGFRDAFSEHPAAITKYTGQIAATDRWMSHLMTILDIRETSVTHHVSSCSSGTIKCGGAAAATFARYQQQSCLERTIRETVAVGPW